MRALASEVFAHVPPTSAGETARAEARISECHPHSQLRGEGNAHGGAGTEEVSQRSFGDFELLETGDRRGLGAICHRTNAGDIGNALRIRHHLCGRNRELSHIDREVRSGIVAVEEVEKLGEGVYLPAFAYLKRPGHP